MIMIILVIIQSTMKQKEFFTGIFVALALPRMGRLVPMVPLIVNRN